jgi:hypothetical protein
VGVVAAGRDNPTTWNAAATPTLGGDEMADLARILEIASIGAVAIPGAGPAIAAGMIGSAKAIRASKGDTPTEDQWKLYQKQHKRWVDECKKMEKKKLAGVEKGIYIRKIIDADLRGTYGKAPDPADVNAFAEAALAAARTR